MIKTVAYFLVGRGKNGDKKMEAKKTSIVIVGMKNSAKFGKCLGADIDATTMTNMLSAYGKPVVLRDSQARKAAVVAALTEAVKADLCIFAYSGHGGSERFADTRLDSTETNGRKGRISLPVRYLSKGYGNLGNHFEGERPSLYDFRLLPQRNHVPFRNRSGGRSQIRAVHHADAGYGCPPSGFKC